MTKQTGEFMFRIGSEEELLDHPPVASPSPPRSRRAAIPSDVPEPAHPPVRAACQLDADDPPTVVPAGSRAQREPYEPVAGRPVPEDAIRALASPSDPRQRQAHRRHNARRQDRVTALPTRRREAALAGLHGWIAWVNVVILTVLVVAAAIGHDPPSTTAASTTITQAAASPTAPFRPATSKIAPEPPSGHRRLSSHRIASIPQSTSATPATSRPGSATKNLQGNPSVEFDR